MTIELINQGPITDITNFTNYSFPGDICLLQINDESGVFQAGTTYDITFRLDGRRGLLPDNAPPGADPALGNGGYGSRVTGTVRIESGNYLTVVKGDYDYAGVFYDNNGDAGRIIMMAGGGGREGVPRDDLSFLGTGHPPRPGNTLGGNAGSPSGAAGQDLNGSTGGGGGTTLGYLSGIGGTAGVSGGDLANVPAQPGGLWDPNGNVGTFGETFTSGNTNITIPASVDQINYVIHGGKGGSGGDSFLLIGSPPTFNNNPGGEGGRGQKISGSITGVAGLTLDIISGNNGGNGQTGAGTVVGGFGAVGANSGGTGGLAIGSETWGTSGGGGGGGGAAAIAFNGDIVVAAGGGGGGPGAAANVTATNFIAGDNPGTTSIILSDLGGVVPSVGGTAASGGNGFNANGGSGGGGGGFNSGLGGIDSAAGNHICGYPGSGGDGYYNPNYHTIAPAILEESDSDTGYITINYNIPGAGGGAGGDGVDGTGGDGGQGYYGGGGGGGGWDTDFDFGGYFGGGGGGGSSYAGGLPDPAVNPLQIYSPVEIPVLNASFATNFSISESSGATFVSAEIAIVAIPPTIDVFSASPNPITSSNGVPSSSTIISWSYTSEDGSGNSVATTFTIQSGVTSYSVSGSSGTLVVNDVGQSEAGVTSPRTRDYTMTVTNAAGTASQTITVSALNDNTPTSITPGTTASPGTLNITSLEPNVVYYTRVDFTGVDMNTFANGSAGVRVSADAITWDTNVLIPTTQSFFYVEYTSPPFNSDRTPSGQNQAGQTLGQTNTQTINFSFGTQSSSFNVTTRAPILEETFNFDGLPLSPDAYPNPDIDTTFNPSDAYIITNTANMNDIEVSSEIKTDNPDVQVSINTGGFQDMREIGTP